MGKRTEDIQVPRLLKQSFPKVGFNYTLFVLLASYLADVELTVKPWHRRVAAVTCFREA
jgi:hypothetical protein